MTGLTVQADDQKLAAQGEPVIAAGRLGNSSQRLGRGRSSLA